jgi:hypothetical protein
MQTQVDASDGGPCARVLTCAALLTVLAVVGAVGLGRLAVVAWQRLGRPGPATLDEASLALAATLGTALVVAWTVSLTCALLAHLPGRLGGAVRRVVPRVASRGTRRLAAVLVGAALAGVVGPGAASADAGHGLPTSTSRATAPPLASRPQPGFVTSMVERVVSAQPPGWTPTRPLVRPQPDTGLVAGGGVTRPLGEVVVHRGECLWDIAARHLGPGATDAEVALAWPAWHEANRSVIGDDPDRVLPGQRLRPPQPVTR